MANFVYNRGKAAIGNGNAEWLTDTFKVSFHTSSYTPDKDHDYFSDVTNEITGGGYTAGGYTLANTTITIDDTNDLAAYDADNIQVTGLTNTFRYLVVRKSTGTPSTEILMALVDLGSDFALDNGTFDIPWPTSGVFNLQ